MPPRPPYPEASAARAFQPHWKVPLALALAVLCILGAGSASAELYMWVDEAGVTHFSDAPQGGVDPGAAYAADVPESAVQRPAAGEPGRDAGIDELRAVWGRQILGPPIETPRGSSSSDEDRAVRLLRGAVDDLRRGETARASATLRSILRVDPRRPEAHWYLALLDRQRGRYRSSEDHLRSFLSSVGNRFPDWAESARRRLDGLEDERKLADVERDRAPLRFVKTRSPNFEIQIDAELDEVRKEYAAVAIEYLESARGDVANQLGVVPLEPLGVVFYGKASYQRAHAHRFSFQTVGFFDGSIHVSSPAHPSGGLRSLLYHEYTHAIFREQTGGDRPYWFNEGLAERIERLSRGQAPSIRSERVSLRTRLEAGQWIPLSRLAPSFSGLSDDDARAAYLESILAVSWINARTQPEERAHLLHRLGAGFSMDQALFEVLGVDTAGLDAAVQQEILSEFPEIVSTTSTGENSGLKLGPRREPVEKWEDASGRYRKD